MWSAGGNSMTMIKKNGVRSIVLVYKQPQDVKGKIRMVQMVFIYGKITLCAHVHKYEWKWRDKGMNQRVHETGNN